MTEKQLRYNNVNVNLGDWLDDRTVKFVGNHGEFELFNWGGRLFELQLCWNRMVTVKDDPPYLLEMGEIAYQKYKEILESTKK